MEIGQPGWMGSLRVAILYFSGVLLGSVGASCIQPNMFLVGASAGVYALITAHLGIFLYDFFAISSNPNRMNFIFFDDRDFDTIL